MPAEAKDAKKIVFIALDKGNNVKQASELTGVSYSSCKRYAQEWRKVAPDTRKLIEDAQEEAKEEIKQEVHMELKDKLKAGAEDSIDMLSNVIKNVPKNPLVSVSEGVQAAREMLKYGIPTADTREGITSVDQLTAFLRGLSEDKEAEEIREVEWREQEDLIKQRDLEMLEMEGE